MQSPPSLSDSSQTMPRSRFARPTPGTSVWLLSRERQRYHMHRAATEPTSGQDSTRSLRGVIVSSIPEIIFSLKMMKYTPHIEWIYLMLPVAIILHKMFYINTHQSRRIRRKPSFSRRSGVRSHTLYTTLIQLLSHLRRPISSDGGFRLCWAVSRLC